MDLQFQEINNNSKKFRCGCYVSDPTFMKEYPNKFIMVPLKSSEYHLEIVNSIANVSLIQSYENPTNKYLELQYSFPISPNACIYRFVAVFGKQRMEGIVKEKEEARVEYKQAVKQGKQAAYGEVNAESKDILTLKVGNVPPNEAVKIEIEYLQQLTLSCNTFYQLHMMGTISPRYMKYIPEDAVAKALRNDTARIQGKFYWDFKVTLKTTRKVHFFYSNSHKIDLISQNDSRTQSIFAMTKASVPNKDFIFSYTTEDYELPSYVFGRTDFGSTAMISFIPKFCSLNLDDAYKASVVGKGFQTDIQNAKGQYIFLLDRSGSMSGGRIQKAKQALVLFIKSLPQDTYFNVVSFGSGSKSMFVNSVKYNDKQVNFAVSQILKMSADMGGTQIYNPLQNLLFQKPTQGYPKQIFLLTDGGVSNTEGVIKMVGSNNKYSRVHTIGIGNGCSQDLILGCAKKGKGYHVFISDQQDPSEKIIQLLTDSLSPVISKMKLIYNKEIVESIIPNPQNLPYILKNQIVNFFITFKAQLDTVAKFEFSYEDSLNQKPFKADITVDPNSESASFIDRMAHFKRIRLLEQSLSNNSNIEDFMFYVKTVDKKSEIIKESVKHQILSELTAFVCTETELLDGKYQQIKDTGKFKVQIVNPPPIQYQQAIIYRTLTSSIPMARMAKCASPPPSIQKQSMKMKMSQKLTKNDSCAPKSMPLQKKSCGPKKYQKKQQSSGGFFSSIKQFFAGKKENQMAPSPPIYHDQCASVSPPKAYSKASFDLPQCMPTTSLQPVFSKNQSNIKQAQLMMKRQYLEDIQEQCIKEETKNIAKIPSSLSISELIGYQSTEGSWKEIGLIEKLFGNDIQTQIAAESNLVAVITYLISKWIQRHHPEKQYSLVVKKGLNFAKKNAANFDQFSQLYDHLVK